MRQCFEPRACYLAARDGSAEDLERIRRCFADMLSTLQAPALAASAETEFHLAIIAATHNGLFVTIGGAVKTALRVSYALTQKSPGRPAMEMEPYEAVLTAIVARRGEAASDAMRRLLELSRLRVLTALDTQPVAARIAG
jgi:DNA-binding FadR family transcriptional regulator